MRIKRTESERIPTGFRNKAQGCDAGATLGASQRVQNAEGVAASLARIRRNPFGVKGIFAVDPRVARSSQPWAEACNPFGIFISDLHRRLLNSRHPLLQPDARVPSPLRGEKARMRGALQHFSRKQSRDLDCYYKTNRCELAQWSLND
jgi:hypothetical protein